METKKEHAGGLKAEVAAHPQISRRGFVAGAGAALTALPVLGVRQASADDLADWSGQPEDRPIVIARRGTFFAGGTVLTSPGVFDPLITGGPGQSLYGDHVYTQFEVPLRSRKLPIVLWHGGGQSGTCWCSTTDGREGYQSIFLRRDWTVHIIDEPRLGRAGTSTVGTTIVPTPGDQDLFVAWRLGIWPTFYPDTKFPQGQDNPTLTLTSVTPALNQFFRQMTVNTGPSNNTVITAGVAALFEQIGPSVLVTHSASGILGWLTAIQSPNVVALHAYEPTDYVFPSNNLPAPIGTGAAQISPNPVSPSDFLALTKIPIRIQYSDHIPTTSSPYVRVQTWVNRVAMGNLMVAAINKLGGNASILHLPDLGIYGNTHFSFADINNIEIADIFSSWLNQHGLDAY
jgi:pimeloyl-ACP methyl ester carboxylesterase